MIRLKLRQISTVADAQSMLQTAIGLEFGTLPPYLYAMFSIRPGTNVEAAARLRAIVMQEMIHMCLACNILNALGGRPILKALEYPCPLPGDIGGLTVHLFPFSKAAMSQGMDMEKPEHPLEVPVVKMLAAAPATVTIGQFYEALDDFLEGLPPDAWEQGRDRDRYQIDDSQFFSGQLFKVHGYKDAHQAISDIISEGEGTSINPLDFQHEVAHYYRFGECFHDRVLTKANNKEGYTFGPERLGIEFALAYPAIIDPGKHDFSREPAAAQAAQKACNDAFTRMIGSLRSAVGAEGALEGETGQLGIAVRAMFDLRTAAHVALTTPLANSSQVAGPAFLDTAQKTGASS